MRKQILSAWLAVCMLLSMMPSAAFAAEDESGDTAIVTADPPTAETAPVEPSPDSAEPPTTEDADPASAESTESPDTQDDAISAPAPVAEPESESSSATQSVSTPAADSQTPASPENTESTSANMTFTSTVQDGVPSVAVTEEDVMFLDEMDIIDDRVPSASLEGTLEDVSQPASQAVSTPAMLSVADGTKAATSGVAQLSSDPDTPYATVYDAVQAAQKAYTANKTPQKITLTADSTSSGFKVTNGLDLTLDLAGHTLTMGNLNTDLIIVGVDGEKDAAAGTLGTLTIMDSEASEPVVNSSADGTYSVSYTGGMIQRTSYKKFVFVYGGGKLNMISGRIGCGKEHTAINVNGDLSDQNSFAYNTWSNVKTVTAEAVINGGYVKGIESGILVSGKGAKCTLNNGVLEATDNFALGGNGSKNYSGTQIVVNGGTVLGHIKTSGYIACGLYHPQGGTLDITGGKIIGENGIGLVMRAGILNMSGGEIVASSKNNMTGKVGDAQLAMGGCGIIVDAQSNYPAKENMQANITGGKITGQNSAVVVNAAFADNKDPRSLFTITGGNFNSDPGNIQRNEKGEILPSTETRNFISDKSASWYDATNDIYRVTDGTFIKFNVTDYNGTAIANPIIEIKNGETILKEENGAKTREATATNLGYLVVKVKSSAYNYSIGANGYLTKSDTLADPDLTWTQDTDAELPTYTVSVKLEKTIPVGNIVTAPRTDGNTDSPCAAKAVKTDAATNTVDVEITAQDVKEHALTSSGTDKGYWVGIGVPYVDSTNPQHTYTFKTGVEDGNMADYTSPSKSTTHSYIYLDADKLGSKKGIIEVYQDGGSTPFAKYSVDASGVKLVPDLVFGELVIAYSDKDVPADEDGNKVYPSTGGTGNFPVLIAPYTVNTTRKVDFSVSQNGTAMTGANVKITINDPAGTASTGEGYAVWEMKAPASSSSTTPPVGNLNISNTDNTKLNGTYQVTATPETPTGGSTRAAIQSSSKSIQLPTVEVSADKTTVPADGKTTITLTAALINGVSKEATYKWEKYDSSGSKWDEVKDESSAAITTQTLTVKAPENSELSGSDPKVVKYHCTATVNDIPITSNELEITFTQAKSTINFTISGDPSSGDKTQITTSGEATAITGNTTTVPTEGDYSFTVTPPTDYEVTSVKIGETALAADDKGVYTISRISESTVAVTVTVAAKTYTATFDLHGSADTVPQQTKVLTVTRPTTDPTLAGSKFDNWYADEKCTTPFDFTKPVKGNVTIHAGWTKVAPVLTGLATANITATTTPTTLDELKPVTKEDGTVDDKNYALTVNSDVLSVKVKATPSANATVTYNGEAAAADGTYSLALPAGKETKSVTALSIVVTENDSKGAAVTATYTLTVTKAAVTVVSAPPAVEVSETVENALVAAGVDKEELTETIAKSMETVDTNSLALDQSDTLEKEVVQAEANKEDNKKALEKVLNTTVEADEVKLYPLTYLDIKVAEATADTTTNKLTSLKLEIEPKTQIVATKADPAKETIEVDKNAVQVVPPKPITVTKAVTIEIELPAALVEVAGVPQTTIYVDHYKGADTTPTYTYRARKGKSTASGYYYSFVNPHGFSGFGFKSTGDYLACIGDTMYDDLQKAVDEVVNGGAITLLKTPTATTVKLKENKSFKFDGSFPTNDITVKDGNDRTITPDTQGYYTASKDLEATGAQVTPTTLELVVGKSGTLTAEVTPKGAPETDITYNWTSSAPDIATVSESGKTATVNPLHVGTTTITVTATKDGTKLTETGTCEVTVTTQQISISGENWIKPEEQSTLTLNLGDIKAENVQDVGWASDNTDIVAVKPNEGWITAVVTGLKEGKATITATLFRKDNDTPLTATYDMTVSTESKPSGTTGGTTGGSHHSSGGGGGSSSSSPTKQDTNVTAPTTVSDNKVQSTIPQTTADKMVSDAVKNKSDNVNLNVKTPEDATAVAVSLPSSAAKSLADKTSANLNVKTGLANVVIPNKAVAELADKGKSTVGVAIEKTDNDGLKITVQADAKDVGTLPGVRAEIPAADATDGTVAVLVNPDGTETVIKKAVVQDGVMNVPINGSATVRLVDRSKSFADADNHWAKDSISFVTSRELFNGISETEFAPNKQMTRAMLVTVLHRLENTPAGKAQSFTDVPEGMWYTEAVAWAAESGIVSGKSADRFAPNDPITREQLATILYRYASDLGVDTSVSGSMDDYTDTASVSSYATEAMRWAIGAGIINGKTATTLDPKGDATRAQVSTMLARFAQKYATDVAYYANAIASTTTSDDAGQTDETK